MTEVICVPHIIKNTRQIRVRSFLKILIEQTWNLTLAESDQIEVFCVHEEEQNDWLSVFYKLRS